LHIAARALDRAPVCIDVIGDGTYGRPQLAKFVACTAMDVIEVF
jgi:hypothetical protein